MIKSMLAAALLAFTFTTPAAAQGAKITIATGVDPSFSAFYVAKMGGFFEKHGLDVQVNTGPSGSAMVAFVIQNQVQSAFGAEQAGIQNHNIDKNVVVAAEGDLMEQWYGLVARNVPDMEALKGKRIGIARGSGSEVFWLGLVEKLNLKSADYKIVQVEAPEMVAALERGDIDAFTSWEPWVTRAVRAIPNTKVIRGQDGILSPRVYIYVNKDWAEKNKDKAVAFMRAIVEATDLISSDVEKSSELVSAFLKLDRALTRELMGKLRFDVRFDDGSVSNFVTVEKQLRETKKLAKPIVWQDFLYPDLLKSVRPEKVRFEMPAQ